MALDGVKFVSTYEKVKNTDVVRVVAQDTKTGKDVGSVIAETAKSKIYNMPLCRNYYTDYTKVTVPHMHISSLNVESSARNQGIGRKLVAYIVKESKDRGFDGKVVVSAGNSLETSPLPFYRRIGFAVNNRSLSNRLDFAAKYKISFDNTIQAFMTLSQKGIEKLLRVIR